jgi:hypothetical protein
VVEYAEVSSTEWDAAMAADAAVRVEPDETAPEVILITGTCPRCGHGTAHVEPLVTFRSLDDEDDIVPGVAEMLRDAARRAGAGLRERDVRMPCGCGVPHPGAPDGAAGCGARWSLHVEWGA